jgi:hypothetical protein
MSKKHTARAAWLLFVCCWVGCQGGPAGFGRWSSGPFGQGSIDRQKARAVTFDPFPLNDIGPPIVGGRPREFSNPMAEAQRNELTALPPPWPNYGR